MSLLDRVEKWLIDVTAFKDIPQPYGSPPGDDGFLALLMFGGFLLVIAMACGHCLAR
jgi:hypothetical protein